MRACVFDMDGTLVDNMRLHGEAWVACARSLGVHDVDAQAFEREHAGKRNDEIFPALLKRPIGAAELAAMGEDKENRYRALARGKLVAVEGLLPFLEELKARGVKLGLATAAPPANRALVLEALGLTKTFEAVVGAEHVSRGKPAPDLFLEAARVLGVEPTTCVAFEDAHNGVRAAVAAGMPCVGVLTTTPRQALVDAGARHTVVTFHEAAALLRQGALG